MADFPPRRPRGCSTICLPISPERYRQIIDFPLLFRQWLDQAFRDAPELFPAAFAHGYTLKDDRISAKRGLRLRRIRCTATGDAFSIRPDFVLPYRTAWADDAEGPLFLRAFGVPFWALARVFGRDPMFWYRMEVGLGRHRIVGTTARHTPVPEHLLADEHHQPRDGTKNYIATTVGAGCCLGAALAQAAGADELQAAYGVFKAEAPNVRADYRPRTVNTDGWAATQQAWRALFPLVVILRCFLHGWLSIRDRAKHLGEMFRFLGDKVWEAYRAPDRRRFAQRLRRLGEWADRAVKAAWVLEQVRKLCGRARLYGQAYRQPGGHRTSNMLDRVMRAMNRYYEDGQHLHGSKEACERHARAWALLYNFRPWHPAVARINEGALSPAEMGTATTTIGCKTYWFSALWQATVAEAAYPKIRDDQTFFKIVVAVSVLFIVPLGSVSRPSPAVLSLLSLTHLFENSNTPATASKIVVAVALRRFTSELGDELVDPGSSNAQDTLKVCSPVGGKWPVLNKGGRNRGDGQPVFHGEHTCRP